MRNLVILGTGRSGTSMVAALFRKTGVFYGDEILIPKTPNPKGYYEDRGINELNNKIIERMLYWPIPHRWLQWAMAPVHRTHRAYWLAAPRRLWRVPVDAGAKQLMRQYVTRQPFCYKDPRFSVSLPVWRRYLPADTRFIVVFRDPDRTVDSMLRDVVETYHPALPLTPQWAYTIWRRTYRNILAMARSRGDWLFVSYDQVLNGTALPALSRFAEAEADGSELDRRISRAQPFAGKLPQRQACLTLLGRLTSRAEDDVRRWSSQ